MLDQPSVPIPLICNRIIALAKHVCIFTIKNSMVIHKHNIFNNADKIASVVLYIISVIPHSTCNFNYFF